MPNANGTDLACIAIEANGVDCSRLYLSGSRGGSPTKTNQGERDGPGVRRFLRMYS